MRQIVQGEGPQDPIRPSLAEHDLGDHLTVLVVAFGRIIPLLVVTLESQRQGGQGPVLQIVQTVGQDHGILHRVNTAY